MPEKWAAKATLRELPGDPAMEIQEAYWIEELDAWIAEDRYEKAIIREAMGLSAKILLGKDLT